VVEATRFWHQMRTLPSLTDISIMLPFGLQQRQVPCLGDVNAYARNVPTYSDPLENGSLPTKRYTLVIDWQVDVEEIEEDEYVQTIACLVRFLAGSNTVHIWAYCNQPVPRYGGVSPAGNDWRNIAPEYSAPDISELMLQYLQENPDGQLELEMYARSRFDNAPESRERFVVGQGAPLAASHAQSLLPPRVAHPSRIASARGRVRLDSPLQPSAFRWHALGSNHSLPRPYTQWAPHVRHITEKDYEGHPNDVAEFTQRSVRSTVRCGHFHVRAGFDPVLGRLLHVVNGCFHFLTLTQYPAPAPSEMGRLHCQHTFTCQHPLDHMESICNAFSLFAHQCRR
jgi:hypothetical protein